MSENNYIWILGENHGSTANNNSYFFWKHVVNIKDGIDKYIVFEKNENTQKAYDNLSDYEKNFVLWKNSNKHFKLYNEADLFFATNSYKDILPNKFLVKQLNKKIDRPMVYLRHGVAGMKRTDYHGKSYWNNMFKFLSFNPTEPQDLIYYNNFEEHQILSCDYLPRYCEFVKKDEECKDKNQILWFITWREYFGSNSETKLFTSYIKNVVKSKKLKNYLKENGTVLKVCVHQFFDRKTFEDIYKHSKEGVIEFVHSKDIDVMEELVKSKALITDYSSVAYDFSLLNRPVLLYQPDLKVYNELREFMCEISEMEKYNVTKPSQVVNTIVNDEFEINPFFRNNWPEHIDYDYIKSGKHILKMYDYFAKMQKNKVSILGWNFYEHDNVVNSTMSLVELLLKEGFFVEVISLYRQKRRFKSVNGLNMKRCYWDGTPSKKEKVSRKIHSLNHHYGNLKLDPNIDTLHPSTGYYLNKFLKNIKSKTVISTSEVLHLYLDELKNDFVENKIYFFHTPTDYNKKGHQTLLDKIKEINIDKSIFVSQRDVDFYENELNFKTPKSKLITASYILTNQILPPVNLDSILLDDNYELQEIDESLLRNDSYLRKEKKIFNFIHIPEKDSYTGLCYVSLEEYYIDDLMKIIDFGNYLKENDIENISIDVVGRGDYSLQFMELILENDLFGFINYIGDSFNLTNQIRIHDFILDLSDNPNYITFYLQGVLNYKKVFCIKNERSYKIFKDIPDSFIESYEWLCNQIYNLPKLSIKDFDDYYWIVRNKHLDKEISEKLIEYIEK